MAAEQSYNYVNPDELPRQLSDESRERLAQYIRNKTPDKGEKPKTSGKVTPEMCNLFGEMREEGVKVQDIADTFRLESVNSVYYHLADKCTHEKRELLTYSECGWMRTYAHQGAPSRTLAMLYDITQENATIHITGKCNHEDGVEPVSPEKLRENSHLGTEMQESICPECGDDFEHPIYKSQRFCSNGCNARYASKKAHGRV